MSNYWPSSWIGTDIDLAKGFTAEQADCVELKYAQLATNGIIDQHSGFPKLEGQVIVPDDDDHIWRLTAAAVKRYRYVADDDGDYYADDDIDPLVWQCKERNGNISSVEIKRLSTVTAAHRAGLTDEEEQRIVSRSYDKRSTIVLPGLGDQGGVGGQTTKKPNKEMETSIEDDEEHATGHSSRSPSRGGSKRKGEEDNLPQPPSRAKRARIDEPSVEDGTVSAGTEERDILPPSRFSTRGNGVSRHLSITTASPADTNEAETDGRDDGDTIGVKPAGSGYRSAFKISPAMTSPPHLQTDEDVMVAKVMEEMRDTAPRTWRAMMGIEETDVDDVATQPDSHLQATLGSGRRVATRKTTRSGSAISNAKAALTDNMPTRKSSRHTFRPQTYARRP
ncbi:hypothetical protein M409DRAFT_25847 [Zasmidium cellare ATCC 36951]|uniref:Uncharacterized protein n=1 Tax=Zasmidium cellare ATCC 36951 TaxID=1080233 RepID=A0A6A6CBR7_ZASCE|nr:uncharacterized protein M409DRAFT_25847 [Zasmidium cellare ATCC 36951]KAF2163660.1 hypothetical protein M409DRAFT_25847 [Zasmidium cellare ATCC 36951]